ncbi:MAG: dihydrolipoyl dehydrogenase [Methylibium sp.]|uniref:dihydrolipoyl dehydrogenase n=1 Tax=Methylibium sp. TaxID=2067992 RepID=UPI0018343429|nr:dihydrolipoyl dehydrogenase [Methylibium sp.]MBA3597741.1 dihydrolipoyl dehydrogenase [Methylibium sp.]
MQQRKVEVAIIGAGSAGLSAWRAAREHSDKVVVIDAGPLGTTCARVGCMPSKLLIAAADAAHRAQHAGAFGIDVQGVRIDGRRVMQRVKNERDRFVGFVLEDMDRSIEDENLLRGHARFVADGVLRVEGPDLDVQVQAERIVIATGSRPDVPAAWRSALGERLIVNDDVFDWIDLPASVAVIGTGVLGLEIAQALHRLGVRVRLLGRSAEVGPLTDPALAALAAELFDIALPLHRKAELLDLARDGDGVSLHWRTPGGEHRERFDLLLAATGRRPNTDSLGLENTTLPLDAHGTPRFDPLTLQVEGEPVFIAGDANHDRPLLHEAADEGRIAGGNAGRWPALEQGLRRTPLTIAFCEPQIAIAGQSHAALRAARTAFATGAVSFVDQGRSRVMGINAGALHVYAAPDTRRLLGAEMIGPAAEHIGHLLAWSVQRGETVDTALEQPFYHPVIEEGLRTALRDLRRKLDTATPCEGCTPGD